MSPTPPQPQLDPETGQIVDPTNSDSQSTPPRQPRRAPNRINDMAKKATRAITKGIKLALNLLWKTVFGKVFLVILIILLLWGAYVVLVSCFSGPSWCGKSGSVKISSTSAEDISLQGQILALINGKITPQLVRQNLDIVESGVNSLAKNIETANPNYKKIQNLAKQVTTKINQIRPLVAGKDQLTGDEQTKVKTELRELADLVGKFEGLGYGVVYGNTALPINPDKITGFGKTLHYLSVNRPFNNTINTHRVYNYYSQCLKSKAGCVGDAADIDAPTGTAVCAPFDGQVIRLKNQGETKESLWIKAKGQNVVAVLAHIRSSVSEKNYVSAGQQVGVVSSVRHLHFELAINGRGVHHDIGSPITYTGKTRMENLDSRLWAKFVTILKNIPSGCQ